MSLAMSTPVWLDRMLTYDEPFIRQLCLAAVQDYEWAARARCPSGGVVMKLMRFAVAVAAFALAIAAQA